MEIIISENRDVASKRAARLVSNLIKNKPDAVLGLATGSTPLGLYNELIRMHREENLDFSEVRTFNLDEYVGLEESHKESYHYFMWENFFRHINIKFENVNIPDGNTKDIKAFCSEYEKKISSCGGIDLQILGIGGDGHIGFNEPTSSFSSRTRIKTLTQNTIEDNARFFGGDILKVPTHVITMGIGTIMESRMCLLLAFGEAKSKPIMEMVEGSISAMFPATILQFHRKVKVFLDESSAKDLKMKEYFKWVYDRKPRWQKDV